MQNKITKSEFARRAGVNPSTTTRLCRTVLAAAFDGKRIDVDHPDAVSYLQNRELHSTPPAATGLDPLYERAVKVCMESGRWSANGVRKELKIGSERAKRVFGQILAAGMVPLETDPDEPDPVTITPQAQKPRGNAAVNLSKKALALAEAKARMDSDINEGMTHEMPDDIEAFADMTLRELILRFGSDTAFIDWLKSTKMIEDINEKRLKNAQTKGELISRTLVKDHVIDTFNSAHLRLMKDGSKSIAAGVVSKHAGGAALPEIEAFVSDIVGSFIKPIKNKITRVLKNA